MLQNSTACDLHQNRSRLSYLARNRVSTVIVDPPGTGKTDVATQIINNIYHNFPEQRTLLYRAQVIKR